MDVQTQDPAKIFVLDGSNPDVCHSDAPGTATPPGSMLDTQYPQMQWRPTESEAAF